MLNYWPIWSGFGIHETRRALVKTQSKTIIIMEPVQAAELVAPMGATNSASSYIMGATNADFIIIFNKFAMYD